MGVILYVNQKPTTCGVYEFGRMVGNVLQRSNAYHFIYCECDNWNNFLQWLVLQKPDVVIFNFFPGLMEWLVPHVDEVNVISVGMLHEVYQNLADHMDNALFDYHIAPDPSLCLRNPIVYKTGRLVLDAKVSPSHANGDIVTLGSFGFATYGKEFEYILRQIQKEYNVARVRFNIPVHKVFDPAGKCVRAVKARLETIRKPGIRLEITHDYFSREELLAFLTANDANIFLYKYQPRRGVSSVTDLALASGRPLVLSKGGMFRHFATCSPSVFIEDRSIRAIIGDNLDGLGKLRKEWSPENLVRQYEQIISDILQRGKRRGTAEALFVPVNWRRMDTAFAIFKRLTVPILLRGSGVAYKLTRCGKK